MQSSTEDNLIQAERRDYEKPSLREFGPVGVLTQGGTGQASEAMVRMGVLNCDTQANKVTDPRC